MTTTEKKNTKECYQQVFYQRKTICFLIQFNKSICYMARIIWKGCTVMQEQFFSFLICWCFDYLYKARCKGGSQSIKKWIVKIICNFRTTKRKLDKYRNLINKKGTKGNIHTLASAMYNNNLSIHVFICHSTKWNNWHDIINI